MIASRFSRLEVLSIDGKRVTCRCDCGDVRDYRLANLRSGNTKSCGCLRRDSAFSGHYRHGESGFKQSKPSPEYNSWQGMRSRCGNPANKKYPLYGARGIVVCARWRESFETFLEDMGRRPGPGFTIDRIDNDGPYSPENCRWADAKTQCANKRDNVWLEIDGVVRSLIEWAKISGLNPKLIQGRVRQGFDHKTAVFATPGTVRRRVTRKTRQCAEQMLEGSAQ